MKIYEELKWQNIVLGDNAISCRIFIYKTAGCKIIYIECNLLEYVSIFYKKGYCFQCLFFCLCGKPDHHLQLRLNPCLMAVFQNSFCSINVNTFLHKIQKPLICCFKTKVYSATACFFCKFKNIFCKMLVKPCPTPPLNI